MSRPYLLLILFVVALAPGALAAENPPAPGFDLAGSDPRAIAVADQVMERMGGREAWDRTRSRVGRPGGNVVSTASRSWSGGASRLSISRSIVYAISVLPLLMMRLRLSGRRRERLKYSKRRP